jgi:hypothetical protein
MPHFANNSLSLWHFKQHQVVHIFATMIGEKSYAPAVASRLPVRDKFHPIEARNRRRQSSNE